MSKRRNRRGDVTRKGMQLAWAIAEQERIREEHERARARIAAMSDEQQRAMLLTPGGTAGEA